MKAIFAEHQSHSNLLPSICRQAKLGYQQLFCRLRQPLYDLLKDSLAIIMVASIMLTGIYVFLLTLADLAA